jgi:hypothetical protein
MRILIGLAVSLSSVVTAHAQSAEQALLGRTDAPVLISESTTPPKVDGARALLGRGAEGDKPSRQAGRDSRSPAPSVSEVDGERALMGRSSGPEAGKPTLLGASH